MLDLRYIREHADEVKANCQERRMPAAIDRLLTLAEERTALTTKVQELQRQQNENAQQMKKFSGPQAERQVLIDRGRSLKAEETQLSDQLTALEEAILQELKKIPNLSHPDCPHGADATDRVVREVGTKPQFDFPIVDHVELCQRHQLADFAAGAKVAGSDFYYLTGDGALLELALVNYTIQKLVGKGFTPIFTPDLARASILEGTGYIPRGAETQIYSVENTDLCLIATAEISLAGMFADEILDANRLPIKYVGLSHCFRTEAGAGGKATRGLFRVHQFTKVEMFAYCLPEQSNDLHEELLSIEEEIFQGLEVPYRVLDIAANDLGGPAYRKYDIEAWMPGRGTGGEYAEVTSTSNCTDYQARRLNIRFKQTGQKGTQFVHMLNGTAVATGRAMIAILENQQQADGTIRVPAVLQPFLGKAVIGTTTPA